MYTIVYSMNLGHNIVNDNSDMGMSSILANAFNAYCKGFRGGMGWIVNNFLWSFLWLGWTSIRAFKRWRIWARSKGSYHVGHILFVTQVMYTYFVLRNSAVLAPLFCEHYIQVWSAWASCWCIPCISCDSSSTLSSYQSYYVKAQQIRRLIRNDFLVWI